MIHLLFYQQVRHTDAKFFDLQEDGSILCEKREDCPDDIPEVVIDYDDYDEYDDFYDYDDYKWWLWWLWWFSW